MQAALKLYDQLLLEIPIREDTFPGIKDHFTIIDKYEVTIGSTVRTMVNGMDEQWTWYLNKLKEAEEMLDNSKDTFKLNLLADAETLKDESKKLLDSFALMPTTAAT